MTLSNLEGLAARDDLLHVVRRWPELRANLTRGGGKALTGIPGGGGDRIPLDLGISDLMREIEDEARFYAHILLEETVDWAPTTSTMPGLLREVAARYGHFTTADDRTALDFTDAAHELARKVDGALGDRERPEYVGPCPNPDHEGAGCPGELFLRKDRVDGRCGICGTAFDRVGQRAYVAVALSGRLLTLVEMRAALLKAGAPMPRSTLYRWAEKGRLLEHAEWDMWRGIPFVVTPTGLYPFADALKLAVARATARHDGRMAA